MPATMPPLPALLLLCSLAPVMTYSESCGYYDVIRNLTILKDPLFRGVRPMKDTKHVTTVSVDFTLYAIVDLDMKFQTLKTFVWLNIRWENEYLTWDPGHFCNISKISVSAAEVWKPDLFVYEMTDEDRSPAVQFLYVSSNGTNIRIKPMLIVSTCGIDTFRFPFDTQTCTLTFGSFMHPVEEIIVRAWSDSAAVTEASKEAFAEKGDWTLVRIEVESHNHTYNVTTWSQLKYKIIMERSPSHYVVNLIVPACFLVLVDLVSMFISMEGGDRLGFKITVVLGFSVLLLILNDLLPSSNCTPILDVFCMVCLMVMIISIVEAIFISYLLQQRSRHPVPRWVRICILKHLASVLFIETKPKEAKAENKEMSLTAVPGKGGDSTEAELLKRIVLEMLKIREAMNSNGEEGKSDWYMVAFVLDRFFFLLYLITVLTILCVVVFVWSK